MDDMPQILKLFAALCLVLGLMGGLSLLLRRFGLAGAPMLAGKDKRLQLVEVLPLDARRKMVLVQRDDVQHLLVLGANSELLVETGISPLKAQPTKKDKVNDAA